MITINRDEFLDWLARQPDEREFDLNGNTRASSCSCPMMAIAKDGGYMPFVARSTTVLGIDSTIHCVGWGYLDFVGLGSRQFTAKQLKEHLGVKSISRQSPLDS